MFGRPERIEPALRKTIERRGWTESLPQADHVEIIEHIDGSMRALYRTSEGVLVVKWRFVEGRWLAVSLDPP